MTPIKKDLTKLELDAFFDVVRQKEKWVLYWHALREWSYTINSNAIFNSKRNDPDW